MVAGPQSGKSHRLFSQAAKAAAAQQAVDDAAANRRLLESERDTLKVLAVQDTRACWVTEPSRRSTDIPVLLV